MNILLFFYYYFCAYTTYRGTTTFKVGCYRFLSIIIFLFLFFFIYLLYDKSSHPTLLGRIIDYYYKFKKKKFYLWWHTHTHTLLSLKEKARHYRAAA